MVCSFKGQCLIFVLSLFSLRVLSQELGTVQVGLSFSPNIDKVIYTGPNVKSWMREAFAEIQRPTFGQTVGINCYYSYNENFTFGSGLFYSKKTITNAAKDDPINFIKDNYYSVDMPFKVDYWLNNARFSIFVSTGINFNVILKNKGVSYVLGVEDQGGINYKSFETLNHPSISNKQQRDVGLNFSYLERNVYRKINISPVMSVGLAYKLNDYFTLRLEPSVKYTLLNTSNEKATSLVFDFTTIPMRLTESVINQKFITYGLTIGISMDI